MDKVGEGLGEEGLSARITRRGMVASFMSIQCTNACPLLIAIVGVDGMMLRPFLGTEREEVPGAEIVSCFSGLRAHMRDIEVQLVIVGGQVVGIVL